MDVSDLYREAGEGAVVLNVHVQPGAGRSAVVGRHGTALKVRVAAAPEGGRANDATQALLADAFGVEPGAVELAGGGASRSKQFRLSGLDDVAEFVRRLERVVSDGHPPAGRRPAPTRR